MSSHLDQRFGAFLDDIRPLSHRIDDHGGGTTEGIPGDLP
jgi:hypothetical protein